MNPFLKKHIKKCLNLNATEADGLTANLDQLETRLRESEPGAIAQVIGSMNELLNFTENNNNRHLRLMQNKVEETQELLENLKEAQAKLKLSKDRAEAASRAKDQFLAGMSHELRTPLNAVLGISEALQDGIYDPLKPSQVKAVRRIEDGGRHLLELISDILDIAKIEAGEMRIELGRVGVRSVCEKSIAFLREASAKKNIPISLTVQAGVDVVIADERRMKQMLVNLLSNAVKFTPDGGRIELEVTGDLKTGKIQFSVRDTGIGISEADLKLLFKPFVQLDSSLSRQYDGAGLGLSLVFHMTELHGGGVEVKSEVGKGSTFSLVLPYQEVSAIIEEPEEDFGTYKDLSGYHSALVIDDSYEAVDQVSRYLTDLSVSTSICMRGEEALNKAALIQPDVVILDIFLPDMLGWQVLDQLKTNPKTKDIPVLVLSVMDDRLRGMEKGAAEYLVKPISRTDLTSALLKISSASGRPQPSEIVLLREKAPEGSEEATPGKPLILLAEDNEQNVEVTVEYLSSCGFRVERAADGSEAVKMARLLEPDLILMDVQMPGVDGIQATQMLRADLGFKETPIIALTALAMPGDRERMLEAGMDDYFAKPFSFKELVTRMNELLGESTKTL